MKPLRWMIYGTVVAALMGLAAALAVLHSGLYSVAATEQHTPPVYWVLQQGLRASVKRHAAGLRAPAIDGAMLRSGAQCFALHCAQCHGAPGVAPDEMGKGVEPPARSLVQTGRDWSVEQIYWVARHGIRMTGMPAWQFRMGDRELWATAAFVREALPRLDAGDYRAALAAAAAERCAAPLEAATPDAGRGLVTLRQYGCHGCHIIPGITGPDVHVGPSLKQFATRPLIAGSVPNTPENLIHWLRDPHGLRPRTLMPDLGVTEQHARDMQAYLATLE